jgi:hypothetical protein
MKPRVIAAGLFVLSFATAGFAADQTWTRMIGDSKCGASHKAAAGTQREPHGSRLHRTCVKSGGEYPLSSKGKVLRLENQKDPALAENAGKTVMVTGTLKGNDYRFEGRREVTVALRLLTALRVLAYGFA